MPKPKSFYIGQVWKDPNMFGLTLKIVSIDFGAGEITLEGIPLDPITPVFIMSPESLAGSFQPLED